MRQIFFYLLWCCVMSEVIPFFNPANDSGGGPSIGGRCVCLRCRHSWEGVAPVGSTHLECPSCKTLWGIFNAPVLADTGEVVWRCGCGFDVFQILPIGCRCIGCGKLQEGF